MHLNAPIESIGFAVNINARNFCPITSLFFIQFECKSILNKKVCTEITFKHLYIHVCVCSNIYDFMDKYG